MTEHTPPAAFLYLGGLAGYKGRANQKRLNKIIHIKGYLHGEVTRIKIFFKITKIWYFAPQYLAKYEPL